MIHIFLLLFMSIVFYRLMKILSKIHLWEEILSFISLKIFFRKAPFKCFSLN